MRAVDEAVIQQAVEIRRQTTQRLPNVDAIIAVASIQEKAILVHRDQHFLAIPPVLMKQMPLPENIDHLGLLPWLP